MTIYGTSFEHLEPSVAYAIWRLRQDVFVVEQECAYPDLDGRDLEPSTRHVVLHVDDDHPVRGYARVLDDGDVWRIGRVLIAREVRGRGWADRIMESALRLCDDERDVVLDAQSPLASWYATFGFEVAGEEFLEDGIAHLSMRLRR